MSATGPLDPLPHAFDLGRPLRPSFAFGSGQQMRLGLQVARAVLRLAIDALLDRLPNLRVDPDVEPRRFLGRYERGATEIPVVFG